MKTIYRLLIEFKNEPEYIDQLKALHALDEATGVRFFSRDDPYTAGPSDGDVPTNINLQKVVNILREHGLQAVVTSSVSYEF